MIYSKKNKRLSIIFGSKSDELTLLLLKKYENLKLHYILIDLDNFNLFYYPQKKIINIDKNISINNLLNYIKLLKKKN